MPGRGAAGGRRVRSAPVLAAVVAVAGLMAVAVPATDARPSQQTGTLNGQFDSLDGEPVLEATRNEVVLELTATELRGRMRLAVDSQFNFDTIPDNEPTCFEFEVNLDSSPVAVVVTSGGAITVQGPVDFLAGNSDRPCSDQPPQRSQGRPATIDAVISDNDITGVIAVEGATLAFSARGTLTAPPGSEDADLSVETLDALTADGIITGFVARTLVEQAACRQSDPDEAQRKCRAALIARFRVEGNDSPIRDATIRSQLGDIAVLRLLPRRDGRQLFPTLNRLTDVIVLLAVEADQEDDDASRRALRRLINLAITIDLQAIR